MGTWFSLHVPVHLGTQSLTSEKHTHFQEAEKDRTGVHLTAPDHGTPRRSHGHSLPRLVLRRDPAGSGAAAEHLPLCWRPLSLQDQRGHSARLVKKQPLALGRISCQQQVTDERLLWRKASRR